METLDCTDESRKDETCLQLKMKKHYIKTMKNLSGRDGGGGRHEAPEGSQLAWLRGSRRRLRSRPVRDGRESIRDLDQFLQGVPPPANHQDPREVQGMP